METSSSIRCLHCKTRHCYRIDSSTVRSSLLSYFILVGAFLVYSFTPIFSKGASAQEFLSLGYLWRLGCAVLILGIYAVLWQQIIKRMPVSDAYMFKGCSIIFILLLSHLIFGEAITLNNGIGAALIIGGMALSAKS